jgi:hypothetical protein
MEEDKVQTDQFSILEFRSKNFQLRQAVVEPDGYLGSLECENSQTMNGGWTIFEDGADIDKMT